MRSLLTWLFIASLLLFAISFCVFPLQSDDLFMYLAMGKKFFELGHFPTTDIFLIQEQPWHMEHQWLSYFFFYGLYQAGGYLLISLTKALMLILIMALPFLILEKSQFRFVLAGVAVMLTCFAANFRFFERSEIFTSLFVVLTILICLRELKTPSRWKWILPSIFVLWINLHPGFPVGWLIMAAAVIAAWLQGSRRQAYQLSICLLLCVLVCLMNPLGLEGVLYPFEFSQTYAPFLKQYYFEWYSPFHSLLLSSPHLPFLLALDVFVFALLIWRQLKKDRGLWFQWLVFLLMTQLMISGVRFAPLFGFAMIALVPSIVKAEFEIRWQKWILGFLTALCFAIAVKNICFGYETISGPRNFGLGVDQRVVPEATVEWMKQNHIQGPLYNSHMFGAYLAWAWDGKYMYDGSITNPDYFINEYSAFSHSAQDFDRMVAKYQIQTFLLDRFIDSNALIEILTHHAGWKLVFINDGSLVFSRQP